METYTIPKKRFLLIGKVARKIMTNLNIKADTTRYGRLMTKLYKMTDAQLKQELSK